MPKLQRIHLYCLCWNDARMLPYFFRHYDDLVDTYFIYDNGSTDGSLAMLRDHGRVVCTHFDVTGDSFVEEERLLSDSIWRQSIGGADWVFIVDIDEHVFHPDLTGYLKRCTEQGITAIRGIGFEMVADRFPSESGRLSDLVTEGTRSAGHDKLCIFNPDLITDTRFGPGRHTAAPEGQVIWPRRAEALLLHFKQLGVDYPIARSAELLRGLRPRDFERGWGRQYQWSAAEIARKWAELRAASGPVPGLGALRDVEPSEYHDEVLVRESGLFDADWYLTAYPDVRKAGTDPVTHFCIHGWREGRKPNFYFETRWYLNTGAAAAQSQRNPLVHYLLAGEPADQSPSEYFDTAWYRRQHGLLPEESPLRHYLERRKGHAVSPLPDFDVVGYCRAHPEVILTRLDPFESSQIRIANRSNGVDGSFPSFRELAVELGIDPIRDVEGTSAQRQALMNVVRRFLRGIPVDEKWYLATYPDAAEAVRAGEFVSAQEHFVGLGYFEGRRPGPVESGESMQAME